MEYLVEMKVTDAERPATLPEALAFIEHTSFRVWRSARNYRDKKSSQEVLSEALPRSRRSWMSNRSTNSTSCWKAFRFGPHTSVRQLIAFDHRIVNIRSRLSRIKTKLQKG
jgi:hypothetical protein